MIFFVWRKTISGDLTFGNCTVGNMEKSNHQGLEFSLEDDETELEPREVGQDF